MKRLILTFIFALVAALSFAEPMILGYLNRENAVNNDREIVLFTKGIKDDNAKIYYNRIADLKNIEKTYGSRIAEMCEKQKKYDMTIVVTYSELPVKLTDKYTAAYTYIIKTNNDTYQVIVAADNDAVLYSLEECQAEYIEISKKCANVKCELPVDLSDNAWMYLLLFY